MELYFAERLRKYRRERDFTQEELAQAIGISPQSVSKWKQNISMPDIALLPVLADIFSVSIDALFGTARENDLNKENIPSKLFESMLNSIAAHFGIAPHSEEFSEYTAQINGDNSCQTAVFTDSNGAVWGERNLGIIFRKNPDEFAKNLPAMSENCRDVLEIFADRQACEILSIMLLNPINYSSAYLSKKCSLSREIIEAALEKLNSIRLVDKLDSIVDDKTFSMWRIHQTHKLLFVYTMLLMAGKITEGDNYYCFSGSPTWCF